MRTEAFILLASLTLSALSAPSPNINGLLGNTYFLKQSVNGSLVSVDEANIGQLVSPNVEKLVFLCHGYLGSVLNQAWYEPLANAFMERFPNTNVILVDWSGTAILPFPVAAADTVLVGGAIGNLMIKANASGISFDRMMLVGHSLGAHVVGFAAKTVGSGVIPNIVGLDPAMLLFETNPCSMRLCKTDAKFVTVIHTNGGTNGCVHDVGHVDFYPNGGMIQPGCLVNPMMEAYCSHMRSTELFIEAVAYPSHFTSTKCVDYNTFITNPSLCDDVTTNIGALDLTEGDFYLKTNGLSPFSIN